MVSGCQWTEARARLLGGWWDLGAVGGLWRIPRFDAPADMPGWLGSDWGKSSATLCGSCMPAVPASFGSAMIRSVMPDACHAHV
jgi:hypothetical protein